MPAKISAVIISKNEVDRISRCIQSLLPLTDDIVVIDNGSTDGTVKLAQNLGAKVYNIKWKGYGPTKNYGHDKAQNDWIISLDADEFLSGGLIEEIKALKLESTCVYKIDRQNYYLGKKINHSGWSPDWVFRIFNKTEVRWNESLVHEKLIIPEAFKVVKLKHKLIHHSYRSIKDHKEKTEKYAKLRAKIWIKTNKYPSQFKRWFGPVFKGFKSYILKLGFLDGAEGWTIAKMNAYLVKRQIYHYDKSKASKT